MSDILEIYGDVKFETDEAVLFNDGTHQVWLPKSQLEDWPNVGQSGEIMIPEWLAFEKGLI